MNTENVRVQRCFAPLLRLGSHGYAAMVRGHEWLYQHGWLRVRTLPRMTIAVGNITAGGTGKTPLVIRLARDLLQRGFCPGVLLRGYKRQKHHRGPVVVRDAHVIHASVEHAGDEAMELARRLPGACIAVGASRYVAGRALLSRSPVDCFILDDGFQHHRLRKDLNIVTLDATDPWGGSAFLPAGLLRESPEALRRADAVVLTRTESVTPNQLTLLRAEVAALLENETFLLEAHHTPQSILATKDDSLRPLKDLNGRSVLAVSAIGNPSAFETTLTQLGARINNALRLRDHSNDIRQVQRWIEAHAAPEQWVLMTEKDAVRWVPGLPSTLLRNIYILRIDLLFAQGNASWENILERIEQGIHERAR